MKKFEENVNESWKITDYSEKYSIFFVKNIGLSFTIVLFTDLLPSFPTRFSFSPTSLLLFR